jgi:mono/diheme cytochrome c family protein
MYVITHAINGFRAVLCYNQATLERFLNADIWPGRVSVSMPYRALKLAVVAPALFLFAMAVPHAAAQEQSLSAEFLQQYCVACHSDNNRTANISVAPLDTANVALHADVWEKILRKVRSSEMPPPGTPQPEPSIAAEFSSQLEQALDQAGAARPDPGRTTIHRLNRVEYSNAVRDLLAIELDSEDALPTDDTGYGFDNIADVLSVSPVLLERYISVARKVSRLAVGSQDVVPSQSTWQVPRRGRTERLRTQRISDDLPFASRGGMSVTHYFPLDAEYVITLDVRLQGFTEKEPHEIRLPIKAGLHTVGATFFASAAREEKTTPVVRRGGSPYGARDSDQKKTAQLDIRLDGARLKLEELTLGDNQPQVVAIAIDGPYDVTGSGDTPSRQRIFVCQPATAADEESCARDILSTLARRAYRRPVTNDEVSPLMGVYQRARLETEFEVGIQRALQAMLVSPHFLFRVERVPEGSVPGESHRVSDIDLASRLSFFLWSSIPDEELLLLAEQGRLHQADKLRQQVRRMVADPRSEALVQNFAGQWLFLRKVDTIEPDPERFETFDGSLRTAMKRETEMLFEEILREDLSVLTLLNADHTYLNQQLAEHYEIPNVYGPQFRRVELTNPTRGGLLGHASILTVTSYANRTSVVQRGAWVLENLLGTPPPPPPPNVPELEAESNNGQKRSMREAMEIHRTNAICASCHARMDQIGFALENYDAIGRWRTMDGDDVIDASGKLPDGAEFNGPTDLRDLLVSEYRSEFVSTATEKLLTYALGRGLEYYDRPVVRAIMRESEADNFRMGDLINGVVESTPFLMRRTPTQ